MPDYALWLVPAKPAHTPLSKLITYLSSLETSSPTFLPHITLWYPVPIDTPVETIKSTLTSIVSSLKAEYALSDLNLDLRPAQTGEQYFQSVLAPVNPTEALLAIRRACEAEWGPSTKEYFPHLSLFYGDETQERREEIAKVANEQKGGEKGELVNSLKVGEIVVVDVRGSAGGWKVMGRVKL